LLTEALRDLFSMLMVLGAESTSLRHSSWGWASSLSSSTRSARSTNRRGSGDVVEVSGGEHVEEDVADRARRASGRGGKIGDQLVATATRCEVHVWWVAWV
jgi:hypothetical protein